EYEKVVRAIQDLNEGPLVGERRATLPEYKIREMAKLAVELGRLRPLVQQAYESEMSELYHQTDQLVEQLKAEVERRSKTGRDNPTGEPPRGQAQGTGGGQGDEAPTHPPSPKSLSPCRTKALSQYHDAITSGELSNKPTDREAYDWLVERNEDEE